MTPTVHISAADLARVASLASDFPNVETGGSFFGLWTHSGAPVVSTITGPGPNSRHLPKAFYQDEQHLEGTHKVAWGRAGLQHIGEWHSHHGLGLPEPSAGDRQTVWQSIEKLNWPRFLLGICCFDPATLEQVEIGLFLFDAATRTVTRCEVRLFDGDRVAGPWEAEMPPGRNRPDPIRTPDPIVVEPDIGPVDEHLWYSTPDATKRLVLELTALELLAQQTGAQVGSETDGDAVYLDVLFRDGTEVVARLTEGFPGQPPEVEVNGGPFAIDWDPAHTFAATALTFFVPAEVDSD